MGVGRQAHTGGAESATSSPKRSQKQTVLQTARRKVSKPIPNSDTLLPTGPYLLMVPLLGPGIFKPTETHSIS